MQQIGHHVTVLYCYYIDWAQIEDEAVLKNVAWNYRQIGGDAKNRKFQYFISRFKFRLFGFLYKFLGNAFLLPERSQIRSYDELVRAAKELKADLYIGHSLGALAIVSNAAKFNNAKVGFDYEDYHRGETAAAPSLELARISYLENKYIPRIYYVSAASPMIAQKISEHFPNLNKRIFTILNCFPLSQQPEFQNKKIGDTTLQLFWFSQTIGLNRGLEILLEALLQLNDPSIHLTLAGRCNEDFKQYIHKYNGNINDQIHFAGIIPPNELPEFVSRFDVGLALEPGFSENNNIALSNKIFTYLLAGNALILSETPMQKAFNLAYSIGKSFELGNVSQLKKILIAYKDPDVLEQQRLQNYRLAKDLLNWDVESEKLANCISEI